MYIAVKPPNLSQTKKSTSQGEIDQMAEIEVTLGRHDERLSDLEKRMDKMESMIEDIKNNTSKILAGITTACVLLVINASIMLAR